MEFTKLPINVDFLAFIDWMRYNGSWTPCKIIFVDTYDYHQYVLAADVNSLNQFSFQDMMRNQKLSKYPLDLLKQTKYLAMDCLWQGDASSEVVQSLFERIVDSNDTATPCTVAVPNMIDYIFLDKHLPNHKVVHFEKDLDMDDVIREYRKQREWSLGRSKRTDEEIIPSE